jgi:hypothetical protein
MNMLIPAELAFALGVEAKHIRTSERNVGFEPRLSWFLLRDEGLAAEPFAALLR